jgi:hypothetical protein
MRKRKDNKLRIDLKSFYFWGFISVVFLYFLFVIFKRQIQNYLLDSSGKITKAVIINKKNYFVNSPVSHEYSYSYAFTVGDKLYKGNSQNSRYNIGDSIVVEYAKDYPSINRPKKRA